VITQAPIYAADDVMERAGGEIPEGAPEKRTLGEGLDTISERIKEEMGARAQLSGQVGEEIKEQQLQGLEPLGKIIEYYFGPTE